MTNSSSWPNRARRGARIAVLLALGPCAVACATPGVQEIRSDLDGIQKQLWQLQKESAALAEALKQARAAPAAPAADGASAREAAELGLRLQAIERDVQAFRTRQDEAEQRTAGIAEEMRSMQEAVQALMRALPAGGSAATAAAPVPGPAGAADGTTPPSGAPGLLPDALYRRAYTDYVRSNYGPALQALAELLERHPESDLADDAQCLIGEIHLSRQEYPEAVAAFEQVIKTHPDGDKAASAYLKTGLAFLEMNRTADAVIQLQHVITAYPKSDEARAARERLKSLGLTER